MWNSIDVSSYWAILLVTQSEETEKLFIKCTEWSGVTILLAGERAEKLCIQVKGRWNRSLTFLCRSRDYDFYWSKWNHPAEIGYGWGLLLASSALQLRGPLANQYNTAYAQLYSAPNDSLFSIFSVLYKQFLYSPFLKCVASLLLWSELKIQVGYGGLILDSTAYIRLKEFKTI